MPRSDKKNSTCRNCGYKFTRPAKLRQHYKSNKNQCGPDPEIITQEIQASTPKTSSQKETTSLSIKNLVNWLANPKIKNNPSIISKKIPKTDAEWFDLMENSSNRSTSGTRSRKKTKVSQPEEDPEAGSGLATQAHRKGEPGEVVRQDTQDDIHFEECPVGRD